jgi:cytochrome b6-f complex subunit 5
VLFLSMIGKHEPSIHCPFLRSFDVVEPLLSGIVLGLIPITLAGLFVAAYLQYKRGNELEL